MAVVIGGGYTGQVFLSPAGDARMNLTSGYIGSVPVARGVWNDFRIVLDFTGQTISPYANSRSRLRRRDEKPADSLLQHAHVKRLG